MPKATKMPKKSGAQSVKEWESFTKRAEPTRARCAKVREQNAERRKQNTVEK